MCDALRELFADELTEREAFGESKKLICEIAGNFAPDYDCGSIYEELQKRRKAHAE